MLEVTIQFSSVEALVEFLNTNSVNVPILRTTETYRSAVVSNIKTNDANQMRYVLRNLNDQLVILALDV